MDSIPPGRLLTLVRPGNSRILRRIQNLKRCNDPEICAAIWLQLAFQAMSSFAKGNPFSLLFGTPFLGDPCCSFFLFFLSPAKVGALEMQPGAKLQAYLGVVTLQPRACTQRFRFRILRRTRSFLDGRVSGAYQVE